MRLASKPPVGIPATVITTFRMSLRLPEASAVKAMMLGIAPPSPSPHRNLSATRLE